MNKPTIIRAESIKCRADEMGAKVYAITTGSGCFTIEYSVIAHNTKEAYETLEMHIAGKLAAAEKISEGDTLL